MSLKNQKATELPITDERMTRFMISLEEAVELVWHAFEDAIGGEIYVKKIPSMKIGHIANAIMPNAKIKIIGIRPGEKLHEQMIAAEDALDTYEYPEHFKILPAINSWSSDRLRIKDGVQCKDGFTYASDNNPDWMSTNDLQNWITRDYHNMLKI
jgi:FlaA1/EpsC-like NDP-sugar epimerase